MFVCEEFRIWNCFLYSWIGGKQLNLTPQYADKGKGFSKTKAAWDGKNGKRDERECRFETVAWNVMNQVRLVWTDPNSNMEFDSVINLHMLNESWHSVQTSLDLERQWKRMPKNSNLTCRSYVACSAQVDRRAHHWLQFTHLKHAILFMDITRIVVWNRR